MTNTHKTIQYNLRITEELRERLKKSADFHNRSMNADIVARLEQTFASQTLTLVGIAPKSPITSPKKYIFTTWNYLEQDDDCLIHNEKARMACCEYMTQFFRDYPNHELIKFEFITEKKSKDCEIIRGIRIWYAY